MALTPRVRGYVVLVVTFVLGIAAGGAGAVGVMHRRHAAALDRNHDVPFGFQAFEGRRLEGLTRRLDLDENQRERIRSILEREREELRALSRDMFERCGQPLRDQKPRVETEIRDVLRPDQRARFDTLVEERRERVRFGRPRR